MYNDLIQLIKINFNIEIIKISILIDHIYSKVYLLESLMDRYVLKEMGSGNYEGEGELTDYLISKGIKMPQLYRTNTGEHSS